MSTSQRISLLRTMATGLRTLLESDFCPGANRYVYWLKNPLAQLLLAAMGGAALGATVAVQGWLICAATLTIALLGTMWPWLGMKGVRASLRVDQLRCQEDETVIVEINIANRWPWPVWGLKLSHGFSSFSGDDTEPDFALAAVPAWSKGSYRWELRPALRGEYPRETVKISTAFPFGLYEVSLPVAVENRLVVHPRTTTVVPLDHPHGKRWSVNAQDTLSMGRDGEVLGTRPYRQGDSLRDVHWSLTARFDRWIVCERQSSKTHVVRVVLDIDPAIHTGAGVNASLEWGLRLSASICESLIRFQSHATLHLGSERMAPAIQGTERTQWCNALARWQPNSEPSVSEALLLSLKPYEFYVTTDRRLQQFQCLPTCRVIALRTLTQLIPYAPWLEVDIRDIASSCEVWRQFAATWEERSRYVQRIAA